MVGLLYLMYAEGVLHRTQKQIVIAIIFFGFWGGVAGLVAWATRTPPPLPTPTPRAVFPVEVVSAAVIPTADGRADLVGLLKNPNADAGARRVRYQFTLRIGGQTGRTIGGETYMLPGRQKYIVAFNEEVPPGVAVVDLRVEQPVWAFVGSDFASPSLILVNRTTRIVPGTAGTPETFEVKGLLANESDVDYFRVEVTTVGLDARGQILGIGESFVGSLRSLERREFTAQWPLPPGAEVAEIIVLPDVNVFRPDAVERREGALELEDVPGGPIVTPPP